MATQIGDNTIFHPDIRKIELEDPGHADTFNPLFKILLDNTAYLKKEKASKAEVDNRINELIGAAPAALDTLQELADALNNDPSFASTMTNELSKKVDSAVGKQLSTEDFSTAEKTKLTGISAGANYYTHPSTHPASMIVETPDRRFGSDLKFAEWDGKQDAIAYTPSRTETGTYTGNNTANRAISLGFQPNYVKVIGNENTFELYPSLSQITPETRVMDGKNYTLNDTVNVGAITATGFTIGSSAASKANKTGQTYTYIAMG